MIGKPEDGDSIYKGSSKIAERVAIVTGGDSETVRSVPPLDSTPPLASPKKWGHRLAR